MRKSCRYFPPELADHLGDRISVEIAFSQIAPLKREVQTRRMRLKNDEHPGKEFQQHSGWEFKRSRYMKLQLLVRMLALIITLSVGSTLNADVVTDWNIAALNAIRVSRTAPPIASRVLAI